MKTKITYHKIQLIFKYNHLLSTRTKKWKAFYILLSVLSTILLSFVCIMFNLKGFESISKELKINFLAFFFYFFLIMELMLLSLRYTTDTIILLDKLCLFPFSTKDLFNYFFFSIFIDIKLLMYFIPSIIIGFGIFVSNIISGIISMTFFIGFYFCLEIWLSNMYIMGSKILAKQKKNISLIHSIMFMILIFSGLFDKLYIISYIPGLNYVATGINLAITGQILHSFFYLIIILSFTWLGLIIGRKLLEKIKFVY